MFYRSCRHKISGQGFTLVELLVVISIIALLSTLAIMSLNLARQKSRDAKRVADMRQFYSAMETFHINNKTYKPTGCATVNTAVSACTGTGAAGLLDIMSNIGNLNDPSSAVGTLCTTSSSAVCNYAFTTTPNANTYTVTYYLEGDTAGLSAGRHTLTPAGL